MSRNTSLFLRISEGKNLPAKDVSGTSDPYCVIKVDNELIARTSTIWKSLNPFWGEEYMLHLPNGFRQIALYVYDEDVMSGDDIIGCVTISKEMVENQPKGIEKWMALMKVDRDDEIQGEIHLEVTRYNTLDKHSLWVKVIEARDLAAKDSTGSADPYVSLAYMGEEQHTHKIKSSRFPCWEQAFEFEICSDNESDSEGCLTVTVWDWDRVGGDDFMGRIELKVSDLVPNQTYNQWFRLYPRGMRILDSAENNANHSHEDKDLGTIRVRARLTEERILPSQYYTPLIQVLMDSVSPHKHERSSPTPLKMLQEVNGLDLMELANTLVKLYLGQEKIKEYLDVICTEEIYSTTNPNTLFRGNSLATKSVDQFMKIIGMLYLHETLCPVIDEVFREHKCCELDPGRFDVLRKKHSFRQTSDKVIIQRSVAILTKYLTEIRDRIVSSAHHMPALMRSVFKILRQRNAERWPGPEYADHQYLAVSGFLFLRFLVPAILSPKLFALRDHHADARTSRTLTLLAKAIQSMGNLGLQIGSGKEQWMEPLHPFIIESVQMVKKFIDEAVDVETTNGECFEVGRRRSVFHPSINIKQGYLMKKRWVGSGYSDSGGDKSKWPIDGPFALKKRYFWLKHEGLSYAKKPTDQVRTTFLANQICGVERVDKFAFSRSNMAQILIQNAHGHLEVLYVQAKDINDLHTWISSIRKMTITNTTLLDMYHPGAYRGSKWSCCLKHQTQAPGCSKTHSQATLGDWRDPLDPDVEAQTIYAQLQNGRDILKRRYLESTEAVKRTLDASNDTSTHPPDHGPSETNILDSHLLNVNNGGAPPMRKSTSFQDAQIASVAQLLDVVCDLEKAHAAFQKMECEKERNSLQSGMGSEPLILHSKRHSHPKSHHKSDLKEEISLHES